MPTGFKKVLISGILWRSIFYASTFILNIIIAHSLGAAKCGPFFFILNNLSIILLVLNFGLESAITYTNSKKEYSHNYLFFVAISWSLVSTSLFTLVYYFIAKLGLVQFNELSYYIIFYILSILITSFVSALFFSSNNHIIPNLIPSLTNILLIIYTFHKSELWKLKPDLLLKTYLLTSIITCFFLIAVATKSLGVKIGNWLLGDKKLLHYCFRFFLTNASITLLLRSDIFLINYLCSDADLGNYIQTTKFSQLVLVLPNLASFALFPLLTQNFANNLKVDTKIINLINVYFYFSLLICLVLIIGGYWVFPLLYGSSFYKMYGIFLLLVPGLLAYVSSYPLSAYFASIDQNIFITKDASLSIIIMILADFILIPFTGIYGAAIGSTISYLFYFLFLLTQYQRSNVDVFKRLFRFKNSYKSMIS